MAVIGKPDLIFLEHPTQGLDSHCKKRVWELILSCQRSGCTMMISSHKLGDHHDTISTLTFVSLHIYIYIYIYILYIIYNIYIHMTIILQQTKNVTEYTCDYKYYLYIKLRVYLIKCILFLNYLNIKYFNT